MMKTVGALSLTLALLTTPCSASDSQLFDLEESLNFMDEIEQEMQMAEFQQAATQSMDQVRENTLSFADTQYDVNQDHSWGDQGEKCDLKALDTEEMQKWKKSVLKQAQQFTRPDMNKEKCLVEAAKLFKLVDTNGNGLIDQCEAIKEYVAFGNSRA